MIDRREFAIGSAVVASIAATGVSACQPPAYYEATGEGLQKALFQEDKAAVASLMAKSVTLVVVDSETGIKQILGAQPVADFIYDLISSKKYHFAPNTKGRNDEFDEILTWTRPDEFGWQKASIWRPVMNEDNLKLYAFDGCGEFYTDSFNVLLSGRPIQSIALVRNELPEELKKVALEHDAAVAKKARVNG